MPRIFDNIEQPLLDALLEAFDVTERADFSVGYFNLRGWRRIDAAIERWAGGEGNCCRLLVGMQRLPQDERRSVLRLDPSADAIDLATAARLKKQLVEEFRDQLIFGAPSNEDEIGLRRLAAQIRARKVVVKLFLAYPLHAKLYLLFRPDRLNPTIGFVGSSNLTLAGLSGNGELNVDVLEHDACDKLARWFEERWNDDYSIDISDDLVRVIEESWLREELVPPYYIYLKMAYHLSQEARTGVAEFQIPRDFGNKLFEFQVKAVKIAAHHLNNAQEAANVDLAYQMFHDVQTVIGLPGSALTKNKQELRERLDGLNKKLHRYLAEEYGIDPDEPTEFAEWQASHKPFHWYAEFYGIMKKGGFDVIIGNPPWREYAAAKKDYTVRGYLSDRCGNLHCLCTERSLSIRHPMGRMSFIVQLPMVSSSRMAAVRGLLSHGSSALHVIPFDDRPGKLFDGLEHCRAVIFLSEGRGLGRNPILLTTRYQRWATEVRQNLFSQIEFAHLVGEPLLEGTFPKYANDMQETMFRRVREYSGQAICDFGCKRETKAFVFYQEATGYWVKATFGLPFYSKTGTVAAPAHGRYLFFPDVATAHAACALLNSSVFYAFFIAYGDCFHLSDTLASGFPATRAILADKSLIELGKSLMADLRGNADRRTINTKAGDKIAYDEFFGAKSKYILDEIDRVLAKHYGFTDEELDFIINYDIKYRMGQDAGEENEG